MRSLNESKRISIVVILLIILLTGLIFLRRSHQPPGPENVQKTLPVPTSSVINNSIYINPPQMNVKQSESIPLQIHVSVANERLDGADAIIHFDPNMVQAKSIDNGDLFSQLARKDLDNKKGTIKVTGFMPISEGILEEDEVGTFFTVVFLPVRKGQTQISIEYQQGKTNSSALVQYKTSKNILNTVRGSSIVIE